jgi:2-amino-4-hydroxy-6-hydroxymethyldihydropteridine diphosphokinase
VETSLEPLALLDRCLEVERELGRVRTGEWAPRTIDLDIIVYGEETISDERLQVPHPRIAERDFVVHPLNAIAPDLIIRGQAVSEMAATLSMDDLSLFPEKLILNART